jgi:hypothetical protein|tara:strand:+ start:1409 stop:1606 length:198 start_codon:yes stop_codon:yes gene_type:complete
MGLLFISHDQMNISHEQLIELTEVVEDTIEYFCDKEQVSGELVWTLLESLATAKLVELSGDLVAA